MAKAKESQKPGKKAEPAKKPAAKAGAVSAKSKTGNGKEARPGPQPVKSSARSAEAPAAKPAAAKPIAKPAPGASKGGPIPTTTGATGRDHPSQSEHAHRLYEKLHGTSAQRTNVPGPNAAGRPKQGFDPNQFRGHQRGFGGGANLIRRTQGRGGGSGGGGGGSSGA